jgi:hypothetical protein
MAALFSRLILAMMSLRFLVRQHSDSQRNGTQQPAKPNTHCRPAAASSICLPLLRGQQALRKPSFHSPCCYGMVTTAHEG